MQQILTTIALLFTSISALNAQMDEIQWLNKLATPANITTSDIEPHGFDVTAQGDISLLASYYSNVELAGGPAIAHNGLFGEDRLAIVRYDKNGNWKWTNTIQADGAVPSVVFNREARLASDPAGNAYVAGRLFASKIAFGNGGVSLEKSCAPNCEEVFLAKYDNQGQTQWAYALQAFGSATHGVAGVDCDAQGNIYLLGLVGGTLLVYRDTFFDGLKNNQQFLMKLDTDGNPLWFKTLEPNSGLAFCRMLRVGHDGNIYVSGNYTSSTLFFGNNVVLPPHGIYNGFVVKYNPDGLPLHGRVFTGKSIDILDMNIDADGRLYLACDLENNLKLDNQTLTTSSSDYNAMLIRMETDNTPNVIYKIDYYNENFFPVLTNTCRPDGSGFYAGGVFGGLLTIGPNELEADGKTDMLLIEYDAFNILSAIKFGGPEVEAMENFQYGGAMGLDNNGYLYVLGFNGEDAEVGNYFFNEAGIFIMRLKTSTVDAPDPLQQKALLWPNPNNGHFKLELPVLRGSGQCAITDLGGRIVHEQVLTSARSTIFAPLGQGVFLVSVQDEAATYFAKLVVR